MVTFHLLIDDSDLCPFERKLCETTEDLWADSIRVPTLILIQEKLHQSITEVDVVKYVGNFYMVILRMKTGFFYNHNGFERQH